MIRQFSAPLAEILHFLHFFGFFDFFEILEFLEFCEFVEFFSREEVFEVGCVVGCCFERDCVVRERERVGAMAVAAGAAARMVCWPMAQQQQQQQRGISSTSPSSSSITCHALLKKRCPDRLNRFLPFAVALPSLFLVKRSSRMPWKLEFRDIRGSARAVAQVAHAATTAGLRETVADLEVDGHSRSFERIHTEQGACPISCPQRGNFVVELQQSFFFFRFSSLYFVCFVLSIKSCLMHRREFDNLCFVCIGPSNKSCLMDGREFGNYTSV